MSIVSTKGCGMGNDDWARKKTKLKLSIMMIFLSHLYCTKISVMKM